MRRRILTAILTIVTLAVVLFGVPLAVVVTRFVDEDETLRVERQAVLASRNVSSDFADHPDDPVELPQGTNGVTFALYDAMGRLVTGNGPARADAATQQALDNQVVDTEVGERRVVAVPIAADERVVGAIRAEQSTTGSDARSQRIILLLASLAAGVLTIGALIGYIVAGRLARPVRRLRDAAVQLGDGDFSIDVPRSRVPELDQAAVAMTATARRLNDLVTRERAFSADASHQLRTPLAGLRANIETELLFPRSDSTEVLVEALSDVERLEQTIAELLAIARTANHTQSTLRLDTVFERIESAWRPRFAAANRRLAASDARSAPTVVGSETVLRHALDVLLDNALVHGGGDVLLGYQVAAGHVTVSVSDHGPGFAGPARGAESDLSAAHGFGLGLATRLVESLPGRLAIVNADENPQVDVVVRRADFTAG